MTAVHWTVVRDLAASIAADRARRGVLTEQEVSDALDEAYRQGIDEGRAPSCACGVPDCDGKGRWCQP